MNLVANYNVVFPKQAEHLHYRLGYVCLSGCREWLAVERFCKQL